MSRQLNQYEKVLFNIINEYNHRFYYEKISKAVEEEDFNIKIEKSGEEMVGKAYITLKNGETADYDIRYNRIINLNEGYTLFVPISQTEL